MSQTTITLAQQMVDLEQLIHYAEAREEWAVAIELTELREHVQQTRSRLARGWKGRDDVLPPMRGERRAVA